VTRIRGQQDEWPISQVAFVQYGPVLASHWTDRIGWLERGIPLSLSGRSTTTPVRFARPNSLYPLGEKVLRGLPRKIDAAYQAAHKVRNIDANAYGVLLGRVLDLVCEDRKASGKTLDQKLKSLAQNGEIPSKLVDVAAGVRKLRNIGAHANMGDLTAAELPVLDDLTRAILEYVYSAPFLAKEAEKRLAKLKTKKGEDPTQEDDPSDEGEGNPTN
jgi:hypothetical protein